MQFGSYEWLHALWFVPVLVVFAAIIAQFRRARLTRFIERDLLRALNKTTAPGKQRMKTALMIAALGFIIIALTRPQWNPQPREVRRMGRDIVFIVDVSRSMLADDLSPSRLERAKIAIGDVLDTLQGDRIALIAFAGTAVVKAPLTLDYGFFRQSLEELSPDSVARGGTLIGDAIRKAVVDIYEEKQGGLRDIILITDGEDHESFPVEAAGRAGELGMRIIAIGLGDEHVGKPIPITDRFGRRSYLRHNGEVVLSKLDSATLRKVAESSAGGVYFNVATGNINLDEVYSQLIQNAEKQELESREAVQYQEKSYIFLTAAGVLLIMETFISDRKNT